MRFIHLFLFLGCIFYSCRDRAREKENTSFDTTALPDTIDTIATPVDSTVIDTSLTGLYQSRYTCKGCDGTQQTLLLRVNGTYELEDLTNDSIPLRRRHTGNWSLVKSNLVLIEENSVVGKFEPRGDSLLTRERQGTILHDTLSRKYALVRKETLMDLAVWKSRKQQGIEFYGVGNEPFWNIEIDSPSVVKFRLAEWKQPLHFRFASAQNSLDSMVYLVHRSKDSLNITILNQFCSDGMSDFIYPNVVKIMYLGRTYSGCGAFLSPSDFMTSGN